jgi:hypothetical protein
MFLSRFVNAGNFYVFWGIVGVGLGIAWVRYLIEPKRTAALAGLSRMSALRTLAMLSAGWYVVWVSAHALAYVFRADPPS